MKPPNPTPPLLTLNDVRFGFPGRPAFLGPISLAVQPWDFWGIIGPNGAGKSTLLRLCAGLLTPSEGSIVLVDRALPSWSLRERARHVSYVPQSPPVDVADTARDVVLMGRFPHRSLGLFESPADARVVEQAMRDTQTFAFADRSVATLSGGEARRVHLAAALAQDAPLLLLDEPTASLDIQHELAAFEWLAGLTGKGRHAAVVVCHDVNLVARYGTHVILLSEGRCVAQGAPADVITPQTLEPVYGVRMTLVQSQPSDARGWVLPVSLSESAAS